MIWNGPEIGECDVILKMAIDLHFKKSKLGVHFNTNNLFNTSRPTVVVVSHILKIEIKFNIYTFFLFSYKSGYSYVSPITIILCNQ